jgi:FkbM family methyltransferase
MSRLKTSLMKGYLRIPYATSLLPSSLLSRGILTSGRTSTVCKKIALGTYGWNVGIKQLLQTDTQLRSDSHLEQPQGQMLQDAWVLSQLGNGPGYFLDIGACHPVKYSNSWILQKRFGWSGLLIEANTGLARILLSERSSDSVTIIEAAVGSTAKTETLIEYGPLSSLERTSSTDIYGKMRGKRNTFENRSTVLVRTIEEILKTESAPSTIDFLSIDIEGADLEVLESFPFSKYSVKMICIEHNFNRETQSGIADFLMNLGYQQKCAKWSSIDSWFIKI